MPYYNPYFLVQKCLKWPKIVFFFPRLLEVCKNWINLIWAVTMQMFMKYFYFSCNSCFGTFILVFPYHGDVVLYCSEKTVFLLYLFLSLKTLRTTLYPYFYDLNSYFCPTFSKFWALLYPCFFTGGHLNACMQTVGQSNQYTVTNLTGFRLINR